MIEAEQEALEYNRTPKVRDGKMVPDTRPLITKLFGDGVRFIRRKELAVVYDKSSVPTQNID